MDGVGRENGLEWENVGMDLNGGMKLNEGIFMIFSDISSILRNLV